MTKKKAVRDEPKEQARSDTPVFKGFKDSIWVKTKARMIQDNQRILEVQFRLRCKRFTISKLKELGDEYNTQLRDSDDTELSVDFVMQVCEDWEINDAAGEPIPWDRENVAACLDIPEYHAAVTRAILHAVVGREDLRRGN